MKLFWSWQSDLHSGTHRGFIKVCLDEAIKLVGEELGLEEANRPEIDHDTKGAAGLVDIPATILRKISEAAIFVADVTPVGRSADGKALPNPNVMIELGFALQMSGPERMIAIFNTTEGWRQTDLPFDLRNRRVMDYSLPVVASRTDKNAARSKLVGELSAAIKVNLSHQVQLSDQKLEIAGVQSRTNDPSVWHTAKSQITHNDAFGGGGRDTVQFVPDSIRAYARVIPSGWQAGIPSVNKIAGLSNDFRVHAPIEGGGWGNSGACSEGFIRYWITAGAGTSLRETSNAVCYFDRTGEFWSIHGTVIADARVGICLRNESLIANWFKFLSVANAALDHLGANPARKIEVGLVRMDGVRWHGQWEAEAPLARKSRVSHVVQNRNWTREPILDFIVEAYTQVKDLFALPPSDRTEVEGIVRNFRLA